VLKRQLDAILDRFDHTCLNDDPPFDKINPSAENIARTIYDALKPAIAGTTAILDCTEVYESPDSWVTYRPD
jgi:6-pyruvoyltetrahydropterin/6-carboxytetrahydropterin synthase